VLKLRLVVPYKLFGGVREYTKAVREAFNTITKRKFNFHNSRTIDSEISTLKVTPSPTSKCIFCHSFPFLTNRGGKISSQLKRGENEILHVKRNFFSFNCLNSVKNCVFLFASVPNGILAHTILVLIWRHE